MKIIGIDGLDKQRLAFEIEKGGKFVIFQYCFSVIFMTFKRASDIYYIPPQKKAVVDSLGFSLFSFLFGWWGVPWGPIYTIGSLIINFSGGKDVTQEVVSELKRSGEWFTSTKENNINNQNIDQSEEKGKVDNEKKTTKPPASHIRNTTPFLWVFILSIIFIVIGTIIYKYQNLSVSDISKKIGQSVFVINCFDENMEPLKSGSGFFVNAQGAIVTNYHVIEGATYAEIITAQNKKYTIQNVLAGDKEGDLILLSVDISRREVKPLTIEKSSPEVGEKIVVISNPLGLQQTVSEGIVSAMRPVKTIGNIVQISAPISPGSSGAPVVNLKGHVIGVVTFYFSGGQNLNFAIPGDRIKKLIPATSVPLSNFFQKNINENRQLANSYIVNAKHYVDIGNFNLAIEFYSRAISIDQTIAFAYLGRGFAFENTNRLNEAINDYNNAIALEPRSAVNYTFRGNAYMKLNDYISAINDYNMAIGFKPEADGLAYAYMQRGIAYENLKDIRQAFMDYEIVIRLDPKQGYYRRGLSYQGLGYYEQAMADIKQAARLGNTSAQGYLSQKGIPLY